MGHEAMERQTQWGESAESNLAQKGGAERERASMRSWRKECERRGSRNSAAACRRSVAFLVDDWRAEEL